ncbi:hypothetical protein SAM9427_36660 (plasmid) [Streptomyces sp. ETH9427]|uniref:hypothetical protein n=1 Tax=Streptomyces sp. E1N211 TaxID=1851876 RepID=UPI000E09F9D3|nr:hypothetical protein [Streptomyces sp. E1N211]AXI91307.1 hypothetical protein SAM9427_36660 [Streptomyces sp. ETH9427]
MTAKTTKADPTYAIDISAERREVQFPHGIAVKMRKDWSLLFPAEIPADALDPLLSDELDLMGLLGEVVNSSGEVGTSEVIDLLFRHASLPRKFIAAVKDIYRELLGEDEFEDFKAHRPSIGEYVRLTKALVAVYGVDLGKLFGLGVSSGSDSETSSPTSPDTTSSTPEASGADQESPDSSDSAG